MEYYYFISYYYRDNDSTPRVGSRKIITKAKIKLYEDVLTLASELADRLKVDSVIILSYKRLRK